MKLPLEFENGGVTITPVVSMTSKAIVTASNSVGRKGWAISTTADVVAHPVAVQWRL